MDAAGARPASRKRECTRRCCVSPPPRRHPAGHCSGSSIRDIDVVVEVPEQLADLLAQLGFVRAADGRRWTLEGTDVFLEAPSAHLDDDANVVLDLCVGRGGFDALAAHELVAPPLARSEALSVLHAMHWRAVVSERVIDTALDRLESALPPISDRSAMTSPEVIEQIGERLAKAVPPNSRVVLFGSHARDNATVDSDFDILVIEPTVDGVIAEAVRLRSEFARAAAKRSASAERTSPTRPA